MLVPATLGALAGLGAWLALAGWRGRRVLSTELVPAGLRDRAVLLRAGSAAGAGLVVSLATGWVVAGLLAAVAVVAVPRLIGGKAAREAAIAKTQAIATWTEMLRDTIAAGTSLGEAVGATAGVAPEPIAAEVRRLASRLERHHLPAGASFARFGTELDHPSADLVVTALTHAASGPSRDLGPLLTRLAEAIRDEARMRIRVEVSRTRIRTAAKVILVNFAAVLTLLAVFSQDYLAAYDSAVGQLVLVVVAALFVGGGWLLDRLAQIEMPERFAARTTPQRGGG